ncbi:hypothetical protein F901_00838 [Acinetobacter dispersus]|nr:hypothetical protein F901_00838 [Acinetobacter dispersus]
MKDFAAQVLVELKEIIHDINETHFRLLRY